MLSFATGHESRILPKVGVLLTLLKYYTLQKSLAIHEGNTKQIQYHDGDFIPDKTY